MVKRISTGALLSLIFIGSNAYTEESQLETVVVIGNTDKLPVINLVGSVDVISQEELAYEHVDDTLELFSKVPGVYLARYNQGIINTDIAIRGFAGDGVTPHAKLLIDGVPANLHNGFNELDQVFPLSIDSITVFKGTSDPRYGLYNIAGNYNVATRQDDAKEIEVTLGSFNTQEIQGYAGFTDGDFTQSYSAGYRTSEGYRDNTDLDKYTLAGSWAWQFDEDNAFRIVARHAVYEGDSPGYFSSTQEAQANPRRAASFALLDGGEKETSHLSLHLDKSLSENLQWQLKTYAQTFERERWVRFSEAGTLRNRFDDQDQIGFISTLNWELNNAWSVDWGVDYEYQDVIEQRFNTVNVNTRERSTAPEDVRRDRAYEFISYGTYLQLNHEPSDTLRWNLALRSDQLDGDFQDRDPGTTIPGNINRDIFDFGTIVQPKFNIVYAPNENINVFANIGRSFQHPFGQSAYRGVVEVDGEFVPAPDRDVSINDGWEIGTQWSPSGVFTIRLSYWQQQASDEFINIDGTNQNVGETDRSGFDIAFNGDLSEDWSYWGSVTTIDTEIVRAPQDEGNELRSIPDFTASVGLNYQITTDLVARIHVDAQGDYFINEANVGGKFGDYTLLNASADYDAGWGTIKFQLNNITDEYFEYAFDFGNDAAFTIHSPGDGINGSISVKREF